jgi:hypothetical protein
MADTTHMIGALFATEGAMYHGIRVSIPLDEDQQVKVVSDGETHGQAIGRLIDALLEQEYNGTVTIMDASHVYTHAYINLKQFRNLDEGLAYGEKV